MSQNSAPRLAKRLLLDTQLRRPLLSILSISLAFTAFAGCEDDTSGTQAVSEPPTLEILGAQNTDGSTFELDDEELIVTCDPRLTVLLGPNTLSTPGLLDNWELRPAGKWNCSTGAACGFVEVSLLDEDDQILLTVQRPSTTPVLNLSQLDLSSVAQISALLVAGADGKPYLVDGAPVSVNWDVTLIQAEDCDAIGSGGAGGAENQGRKVVDRVGEGGVGGAD